MSEKTGGFFVGDKPPLRGSTCLIYNHLMGILLAALMAVIPAHEFEIKPPVRIEIVIAEVTMYNAHPAQTDSDPLITASGSTVNEMTAACPSRIEFGTRIMVQGREYVCEDRMNRRYRDGNFFDLIAPSYDEAKQWGRKKTIVEVF